MGDSKGRARTAPGPETTRPAKTESLASVTADNRTRAQQWAAAWLAGPHSEPDCPTCSAGWALIDGGRRD
jgi:hypothetical protein